MNEVEQVFDDLKQKVHTITDKDLTDIFDQSLTLASKFKATGQIQALKKLVYVMDTIEVERKLIYLGIQSFIYKDDIDFYIDNQKSRPIKIIEFRNYEREIPDEIAQVVEKVGSLFDELYVLYTDYTGKVEKRIEAEKRSTDPILFGVFMNQANRTCIDRFYVLGDWIDPYCDLTLEKLVSELSQHGKQDRKLFTPQTLPELKSFLEQHKESKFSTPDNVIFTREIAGFPISGSTKNESWFSKVKRWFK